MLGGHSTARPALVAGVVSIGLALGPGGLVTHSAQDEAPDGVVNDTRAEALAAVEKTFLERNAQLPRTVMIASRMALGRVCGPTPPARLRLLE